MISCIYIYYFHKYQDLEYFHKYQDRFFRLCKTEKRVQYDEGIGILLDGLFGTGTGSTVSVENVGLLGLTRVGSRRVVQISAGFMIFFATLGKFGAVFASTPFSMYAALYCVLFGLVGSVGISFLQFTNMNSMRNLIITGVSLFLGISIPQFFNEYLTPNRSGLVHTNAVWC